MRGVIPPLPQYIFMEWFLVNIDPFPITSCSMFLENNNKVHKTKVGALFI